MVKSYIKNRFNKLNKTIEEGYEDSYFTIKTDKNKFEITPNHNGEMCIYLDDNSREYISEPINVEEINNHWYFYLKGYWYRITGVSSIIPRPIISSKDINRRIGGDLLWI